MRLYLRGYLKERQHALLSPLRLQGLFYHIRMCNWNKNQSLSKIADDYVYKSSLNFFLSHLLTIPTIYQRATSGIRMRA